MLQAFHALMSHAERVPNGRRSMIRHQKCVVLGDERLELVSERLGAGVIALAVGLSLLWSAYSRYKRDERL